MTAKEYLKQALFLDDRINDDVAELALLRKMSASVSSPQLGERVQTTRNLDAPYIRQVEEIIELEKTINKEIDRLVDMKKKIRRAIEELEDPHEAMVLKRRYLLGRSFGEIAKERGVAIRTIQRWHNLGLQHIKLAEEQKKD